MEPPRLSPLERNRVAAMFVISVVLAGFFVSSSPGSAAGPVPTCNVSGPIVVDTTWGLACTWVMVGNVTVNPGVTLTIVPGASVQANPLVHLYVRGALIADGAAGNVITFAASNSASNVPWGGIQFNATSTGSVTWASISRAERAIYATQSSPTIDDNVIDTCFFGIILERSGSSPFGNQINYTNIAIQASGSGDVTLAGNTITNVTGNPALGIYVTNLQSLSIWSNTIQGVVGANGRVPVVPGGRGTDGGYAVAILVNGTPTATIQSNTLTQVVGGQAGNGAPSSTGNGGRGGDGGSAGGIVTFGVAAVDVQWNSITGVSGGRGGNGALSTAASGNGGSGGIGGTAAAVQGIVSATSALWSQNWVSSVVGGSAGDGGSATVGVFGNGGLGADAYGFLTGQAMDGVASWNNVQFIQGGHGGNSSNGPRGSSGGGGGQAAGFWSFGVDGSGSIQDNRFTDLTGGAGGAGRLAAGYGGSVTGVLTVGDGKPFNVSAVQGNTIANLTGGSGGVGTAAGASGGGVAGLAAFHVQLDSAWNGIDVLTGGKGGDAFVVASPAGRGGDSTAFIAALLPKATSISDTIQRVTKGPKGSGTGNPVSYGVGLYAIGNSTVRTYLTMWNGTFSAIGDLEIHVDNYTEATTVNTPFSPAKLAIQATGNLTVRNFLAVEAYWPNNFTPLNGASVRVTDDGIVRWNVVMPGGTADWLVVTDRVYMQSTTTIHDNRTDVSVSYASSLFWDNPRSVDMATSHSELFGMIDQTPPSSSASPLPTYETALMFTILYTYQDGNGTGVQSVSLWYRASGSASWILYSIQLVPSPGGFSFTAPSDGTYEFCTTATDASGNTEPTPATNDTWTIVDTVHPGSHVRELATYQTSLSFLVSWISDPSVTDIMAYRIEYNAGSGWTTWLADTHATSGTFPATSQGLYAFRSIARDAAGNLETPPITNDTWTIVDTIPPGASISLLGTSGANGWYRSAVTVTLSASDETSGVASISYRVDGGTWQAYAGPFLVSGDGGHTVDYFATDRAGLAGTTASRTVQIDTTQPFGTAGSPRGANTDTSRSISITFNEPMNRTSVEQAFSISPGVTGAFAWSADSRSLVFQPDSVLVAGRDYVVRINSSGQDMAGNSMSGAYTFSFTTTAASLGFSLSDSWWIFLLVAIAAGTAMFLFWQRQRAAGTKVPPATAPVARKEESSAIIEDVFLLYHRDGVLIKHETRRLRPDVDTDILSGMLTAVQAFVKDALRGDDYAELNEMTVGHMHILIGRGKWLVLATRIEGDGSESWTGQIERCIKDMEDHHWDQLEDWDGDMTLARVLMPYLKKLIQGAYALVEA